jgi:hypothetical protein
LASAASIEGREILGLKLAALGLKIVVIRARGTDNDFSEEILTAEAGYRKENRPLFRRPAVRWRKIRRRVGRAGSWGSGSFIACCVNIRQELIDVVDCFERNKRKGVPIRLNIAVYADRLGCQAYGENARVRIGKPVGHVC